MRPLIVAGSQAGILSTGSLQGRSFVWQRRNPFHFGAVVSHVRLRIGVQQIMDSATVRNLIEKGLPDAKVQVQGPDGVHFEATIISSAFNGKLPLARHRMVYATLGDLMGSAIHALSLRTLTPDENARGG